VRNIGNGAKMATETASPIHIFIAYSHLDERYRNKLNTHLASLRRAGIINDWYDRKISPGEEWESVILANLEKSQIVLLMVSADFIASDYCYNKEMKKALEMHESKQAIVIPVIVRAVDWRETPISKLQALPKDGKAVTLWSNQDQAWTDVVRGIKRAIEQVKERQANLPRGSQPMQVTNGKEANKVLPLVANSPPTLAPHIREAIDAAARRTTGTFQRPLIQYSDVHPNEEYYQAILELCSRGILNGYNDGTFRPNNSMTHGQFAKLLSNAAGFSEPVSGQSFEDVPINSSFYMYIERVADRFVTCGYECGTPGEPCIPPDNKPYFRPNELMTKKQLAIYIINTTSAWDKVILYDDQLQDVRVDRAHRKVFKQTFEDVPPTILLFPFIARLAIRGILTGHPCGTAADEPCVPPDNLPYLGLDKAASRGEIALAITKVFFPEALQ
jgi:hypothetical protein